MLVRAQQRIAREDEERASLICSETVERTFYNRIGFDRQASSFDLSENARGQVLASSDRLRLQIMISQERELFSWPGESKFQSRQLDQIIGGASTTGKFWPFVSSIFLEGAGTAVRFVRSFGESDRLLEYRFNIPEIASHYMIRMGDARSAPTAFEGAFAIDSHNGGLRHLTIEVGHPPPETGVVRAEVDTAFEDRDVGGRMRLLPVSSTFRMLSDKGNLAVNKTRYGSCQLFASQSTIRFDESVLGKDTETEQKKLNPKLPALPSGLVIYTRSSTRVS